MSDVKVQLTEDVTPSQQAIAKVSATVQVTDARGRVITLKKPGVLAQFRLMEAAGPETARNEAYMASISPLMYVVEIDGDPVYLPSKKSEIEALIQRLDNDGLQAVLEALIEHWGKAADPEADKTAIKK